MADGTVLLASDVRPGDMVLSYNLETHLLQPSMITYVGSLKASNTYVFNNELYVDSNELMFINGKWERAYQAKLGDKLFNALTGKNVTITSLKVLAHSGGTVYDFIGSPVNNYIADGFLIDKDKTIGDSVLGNATITMANGSTIPVGSLRQGNMVMSYNLQTGQLVPSMVVSMHELYGNQTYLINHNLITDGYEDMIINGTNQEVKSLKVGDTVFNPLTGQNVTVTSIIISNLSSPIRFYDINTAPTDDYVVNNYLVT